MRNRQRQVRLEHRSYALTRGKTRLASTQAAKFAMAPELAKASRPRSRGHSWETVLFLARKMIVRGDSVSFDQPARHKLTRQ